MQTNPTSARSTRMFPPFAWLARRSPAKGPTRGRHERSHSNVQSLYLLRPANRETLARHFNCGGRYAQAATTIRPLLTTCRCAYASRALAEPVAPVAHVETSGGLR